MGLPSSWTGAPTTVVATPSPEPPMVMGTGATSSFAAARWPMESNSSGETAAVSASPSVLPAERARRRAPSGAATQMPATSAPRNPAASSVIARRMVSTGTRCEISRWTRRIASSSRWRDSCASSNCRGRHVLSLGHGAKLTLASDRVEEAKGEGEGSGPSHGHERARRGPGATTPGRRRQCDPSRRGARQRREPTRDPAPPLRRRATGRRPRAGGARCPAGTRPRRVPDTARRARRRLRHRRSRRCEPHLHAAQHRGRSRSTPRRGTRAARARRSSLRPS